MALESWRHGVSVILPTYNRASTLGAAIQSVLFQSIEVREIVVVDDGSNDNTSSLVETLALSDPRVRYLKVPHGGAARARNAGLQVAGGVWVAFMDSDDRWDREFLERLVPHVTEQTIVFSSHTTHFRDGAVKVIPPGVVADVRKALWRSNPITTATVLLNAELIRRLGAFDPGQKRYQDWELWLRAASDPTTKFVHVNEALVAVHRNADSISEGSAWIRSGALLRILRKHWRVIARHDPVGLARLIARTLPIRRQIRRVAG